MHKTNRRFLCLLFACLFAFSAAISAAADAWIPPDDCNIHLIDSCYYKDECRALNVFVSNYIEANVQNFSASSPVSAAINGTLKHFELNPDVYPDEVSSFREDGTTYMKIKSGTFERKIYSLFRRDVDAEDCQGYQDDGTIIVSAENYDAAITVFGSVYYVEYITYGEYIAHFDVFRSLGGVAGKYNIPCYDLPESLEKIGSGEARFNYYGDPSEDSFVPTDFSLLEFSAKLSGSIPCTNENSAYRKKNAAGASGTTTETVHETLSETTEAQPVPTKAATKAKTSRDVVDPIDTPRKSERKEDNNLLLVLLATVIVLSAALVFLIVFFIFRSKEKKKQAAAAPQPAYPTQAYPQTYYQPQAAYPPEQMPLQQYPTQQIPPQNPQQ
ncbi:MAG: hypothetical protein MJ085_02145 [Clostridia bacterium]|nr:hypothetical protein [Clostridia bacterium]